MFKRFAGKVTPTEKVILSAIVLLSAKPFIYLVIFTLNHSITDVGGAKHIKWRISTFKTGTITSNRSESVGNDEQKIRKKVKKRKGKQKILKG